MRQTSTRFELEYHIDSVQLAAETCCDGVFPLITNDGLLSELELLLAYKGQPSLEKRFSQMKTDFEVAPVYLKEASRHPGVALCVFPGALDRVPAGTRVASRLWSREAIGACRCTPRAASVAVPTARRVIDLFEDVQRHSLRAGGRAPMVFTTELSRLQTPAAAGCWDDQCL